MISNLLCKTYLRCRIEFLMYLIVWVSLYLCWEDIYLTHYLLFHHYTYSAKSSILPKSLITKLGRNHTNERVHQRAFRLASVRPLSEQTKLYYCVNALNTHFQILIFFWVLYDTASIWIVAAQSYSSRSRQESTEALISLKNSRRWFGAWS